MSEPKLLLRRPLPPKVETVLFIPKRKDHKGSHGEDTESKEMPGDGGATGAQLPISVKSHQVILCWPDSTACTSAILDFSSGSQSPGLKQSYLDSIKKNVIIPVYPTGPPSFPVHKWRIPLQLKVPALKFHQLFLPSDFILKGLTAEVSRGPRRMKSEYKKPIISKLNYEVHSRQLIHELQRSGQVQVHRIQFPLTNIPFVLTRKPETLLGIVYDNGLVTSQTAEITEEAAGKKFLQVEWEKRKKKSVTYSDVLGGSDSLSLVSGVGCTYQSSPEDQEMEVMAKAEMALYCCLLHKRTGLSLKAYFLPRLPDLSPLADFLLYLNVSFNNLRLFPREVCDIKQLQVLNLQNNPIKFIPEDIKKMKCLKSLVISFNLLTEIPPWLFSLPELEHLDASYNEIEYISNAISNARNLSSLILEGNFLRTLPCGILSLQLNRLRVENNFLHSVFWNEVRFQPQRLTDMAALCFVQNNLRQRYAEIPKDIQELLHSCDVCDCCKGPLYGQGLRFLRIYRNIYGLRLPYLFSSCSSPCYTKFVS